MKMLFFLHIERIVLSESLDVRIQLKYILIFSVHFKIQFYSMCLVEKNCCCERL